MTLWTNDYVVYGVNLKMGLSDPIRQHILWRYKVGKWTNQINIIFLAAA
jgi:hypothetical protein